MKEKLIFFDIDGTIIDHFKKEIPQSTITALKLLQANNHQIAVASGKDPIFIENLFSDIKLATYVALNGNYVVLNNKIIYKNYLTGATVKKFVQYCLKNQLAFVVIDEQGIKTLYHNDERIKKYYQDFTLGYPKIIDNIDDYDKYLQMTIMIKEDEEKIIADFPELTFVRMSDYGMNVIPNGGMKEKGIKKILAASNYTSDDLVVFGDGLNDISMFKLAKTSVAMGNAYQQLKDCATLVTDHISENGVYNACKKLELF